MNNESNIYPDNSVECSSFIPKKIATITVCGGALTFVINEGMPWKRPTDEQIYNLKNLFGIEVILEN